MFMPKVSCSCVMLVEVVQHHLGQLAALELDHHADALLVGFVADVGDAFQPLLGDLLGDALEQRLLVHLVGQLVDDDRLAVALAGMSSKCVRARITTRPRPVR